MVDRAIPRQKEDDNGGGKKENHLINKAMDVSVLNFAAMFKWCRLR